VQALKQKVSAVIDQENKSDEKMAILDNELDAEEQKILEELKKSAARTEEVGEEAEGDDDEEEEEEKETMVEITTVLLTFLVLPAVTGGGRRRKTKVAWAMTLWADGPATCPVKNFNADKLIMKEYNQAVDRGTLNSGCTLCTNTAKLTEERHVMHVAWHKKFRTFFALRQKAYPNLKDMDQDFSWSSSLEKLILAELVELWNQADPDAPYFRSLPWKSAQQQKQNENDRAKEH
jgi:hypothetical protein